MSRQQIPLLGGESVYCINRGQLDEAVRLANDHPDSSPLIQRKLAELEGAMSRNELAALAFIVISRLLEDRGQVWKDGVKSSLVTGRHQSSDQ